MLERVILQKKASIRVLPVTFQPIGHIKANKDCQIAAIRAVAAFLLRACV